MIAQPKPLPTTNAPQEGFVLIVGLVILGLLTMLALSSMRDTTMQEKMAGASRDSGLAFQAAESALRDAENCITGTTAGCAFDAAANDAHFAQNATDFPKHNNLFNANTWAAIDPPGGNQPPLPEFPPKGKAMPRTGSITSSARQAPLAATRAAWMWVFVAIVAPQQQSPKQSMKSPLVVRAPAARVNRSCAFTFDSKRRPR